jgi:MOSC domain-containing protein YiiM
VTVTDSGVEGDRWSEAASPKVVCQVTLMSVGVASLVAGASTPLHAAGDNFLVDLDLSETALPAGAKLRLGNAVLEVSAQPHLGCRKFAERFGEDALRWVNDPANRALRLRGVNCRVVGDGEVAVGDAIEVI